MPTCTITKSGRSDEYGRPLLVGSAYTGTLDQCRALFQAGFATVASSDLDDGSTGGLAQPFITAPLLTPTQASQASVGGDSVATTVTATSTLPASALGAITPINAASATVQTLPPAAAAWASNPYGLVVLSIKGAGIPTFSAGAGDTLRATSGIAAGVQYGMIAAQIISATEWALA